MAKVAKRKRTIAETSEDPLALVEREPKTRLGLADKPTLKQSINIVMLLANEEMMRHVTVAEIELRQRQELALEKVQAFLNRAYAVRKQIKKLEKRNAK